MFQLNEYSALMSVFFCSFNKVNLRERRIERRRVVQDLKCV